MSTGQTEPKEISRRSAITSPQTTADAVLEDEHT